jgi:mono/diheme cytochrome c family protein
MNLSRIVAAITVGLSLTAIGFAADAATTWSDQCAKCHGADGKGDTKMGKKLGIADLTDAKTQAGFTDEQAAKAIKEGLKDKSGKTTMKAIEGLTDADIKALVPYVRGLKK